MSFQPQATMMSPPPPVVAASKGKRHKGLIVLGLVLLLGGVLGGGAMVAKSMSNYEESVKSLARAPVGCTTTLVFDKPATFTVYIETKGKLGKLGGDCETSGSEYSHPGDKLPKVSLTLVDSKGNEVTLDRGVSATYDVSGFKGTGVRSMVITEAGTYRLNVESDDTDFAVAIGKDPKKDSDLLKAIGGGVALGGLVLGLLFLLLGLRRRRIRAGDGRHPQSCGTDARLAAEHLSGHAARTTGATRAARLPPGAAAGPTAERHARATSDPAAGATGGGRVCAADIRATATPATAIRSPLQRRHRRRTSDRASDRAAPGAIRRGLGRARRLRRGLAIRRTVAALATGGA